ncbi:MAG: hypothetical protein A2X56_04300 [Nitrospirae bacterium GWC2_57_13]|jgi:hypothetical protein|nr:MAG: hypothetical protein A2X56_04300 [Nitrospirae bacterium GWC2_57_13]
MSQQIISASRRTDIPAFYTDWFLNRLREGFADVLHPYTRKWLQVSLKPEDMGAIVFWSKNYAPLLPKLDSIEKTTRNLFFHFTITGNRELELRTPDVRDAVKDYIHIATRYSPDHIIWRFDPICITDKLPFDVYEDRFIQIAELLRGHARECIISFAHPYGKALRNIAKYTDHSFIDPEQRRKKAFADHLAGIAKHYGIRLSACCSDYLLSDSVHKAACIDGRKLSLLFGTALDTRTAASRRECGCTKSIDIGAYDTCGHGCGYCYANTDQEKAMRASAKQEMERPSLGTDPRMTAHNPENNNR